MTVAICIKCGAFKFGAFSSCEKCGATPETEDDVALSMMTSDHFHSQEELGDIGKAIASGKKIALAPDDREKIINTLGAKETAAWLKRINENARKKGEGS